MRDETRPPKPNLRFCGKVIAELVGLIISAMPMSLEENKAIIQGLFEAFNKHNLDLLDSLIAPDFVDNTLQLQGLDSFKKSEAMFIEFSRLL